MCVVFHGIYVFIDAIDGLKKQYAQLQSKKQSTLQTMEQEDREYEEMMATNSELREQRDKLASKISEMKDKIEILSAEINREGASTNVYFKIYFNLIIIFLVYTQNKTREEEKLRLSKNELSDFQKYLGLQIIPLPNNQTRFTFNQIDPKRPEEITCSFVVDVSEEQYRVLSCIPGIPDMEKLVDDLNQHRDFYRFLKLCRQRFVAIHQ